MREWHEKVSAKVGLRLAGIALLASAWAECTLLRNLILERSSSGATPLQMLIAAIIFVSASFGSALLVVSSGLWKQVRISDRWANRIPSSSLYDCGPSSLAMTVTDRGDSANQQREIPHVGEKSPVCYPHLPLA